MDVAGVVYGEDFYLRILQPKSSGKWIKCHLLIVIIAGTTGKVAVLSVSGL